MTGHQASREAEAPAGPLLSIGVFSRRSRLSPKALRLYDRLGLLKPSRIDEGNGYRWYRESQLQAARMVAMLRRLDMPLEQVKEVLAADGERGAEMIASHWASAERRIASQRELAAHLETRLRGGEGRYDTFPIQERDVPEQQVLTVRRHLNVDELSRWLATTSCRLAESARGRGGVTGPLFAVYHGEVDEDSDGPVELCAPIAPSSGAPSEGDVRLEPAHREAYVRLSKAQVEYPQILSAFDAVAGWIASSGRKVAAPPREVYFSDWDAAGPTDEVCDVAFPIR